MVIIHLWRLAIKIRLRLDELGQKILPDASIGDPPNGNQPPQNNGETLVGVLEFGEYCRITAGQDTLAWIARDYDGSLYLTTDTGSGLESLKLTDGPNEIASTLANASQTPPPIQSGGGVTLPPPNQPSTRVPQEGDPDFVGPVRPPSVIQIGGITYTTTNGASSLKFGNYEIIVYTDGRLKVSEGNQYIVFNIDGSIRAGSAGAGSIMVWPPRPKK